MGELDKKKKKQQDVVKPKGNVIELGTNVYSYNKRSSGEYFTKVTEAIADYCARDLNDKDMRALVLNGIEKTFKKPKKPNVKQPTPFDIEEYRSDLKEYNDSKKRYEQNKAQVFIIIRGQCLQQMKNRIESHEKYKEYEINDDVVNLIKIIKEIMYSTTAMVYNHWNVATTMSKLHSTVQYKRESLVAYYKRFVNMVDVVETQWGKVAPIGIAEEDPEFTNNQKKEEIIMTARDHYLACVFIRGVDKKRHNKCVDSLHNDYMAGNNRYPKNIEEALNYVSNYVEETLEEKKVVEERYDEESRSFYANGKVTSFTNDMVKSDDDSESDEQNNAWFK